MNDIEMKFQEAQKMPVVTRRFAFETKYLASSPRLIDQTVSRLLESGFREEIGATLKVGPCVFFKASKGYDFKRFPILKVNSLAKSGDIVL